ncbi:WLM-domain-containing protein [Sodiomyces alkalinus F11]|uniref:WLM-domain-containing protein n=1 Tax=Sodiomyces alkalinus (strain CBS 110278 / VKM F-3762 / F11) TaxID=1314773 RepID=A0A3N2QA57_SODAK|nr:WLM-domain-containing protein [Sodiomyces alkalinus F11]ROT43639.1 WLM-domain-containing protein [Sodiomyces alkalinus F11]
MREHDPLVLSYSHLAHFPRASEALQTLKKVASLVKPIMRARKWKVGELAEFLPNQHNLLGLNVNRGAKILLRLRHAGDRNQFLAVEQVVDTMLHELSHIVHGPHDDRFHALWNQLRDEHEGLVMKGYTGEGFLSAGRRLGGGSSSSSSSRRIPMQEARRLARAAAEERTRRQKAAWATGSGGRRVGGAAPRPGPGQDIRRTIAAAAERRKRTMQGCGTAGGGLGEGDIRRIEAEAARGGFRTKAEEDAANEAAIAQALWELVQEEEKLKYGNYYVPPSAERPEGSGGGSVMHGPSSTRLLDQQPLPPLPPPPPPQSAQRGWTCGVCTLHNPSTFLCCDACGAEKGSKTKEDVGETRWTPNEEKRRQQQQQQQQQQRASMSGTTTSTSTVKTPPRRSETIDLTESPPNVGAKQVAGDRNRSTRITGNTRNRRDAAPSTAAVAAAARPAKASDFWQCSFCGTCMEREWWTCSACGLMKDNSR